MVKESGNVKKHSNRRDKRVICIEEFIENHNGKIQIVLYFLAAVVVLLLGLKVDLPALSVMLIGLIAIELIVSEIKNSSLHRKVNDIGRIIRNKESTATVKEQDLTDFFNLASKEIFLSGISLSHIIDDYGQMIQKKLETGVKLKIMLLDPDSVNDNVKYLYRNKSDNDDEEEIKSRIKTTIKHITKIRAFEDYLEKGTIEIKYASGILPISVLMYDFSEQDIAKDYSKSKNLYVRTYLFGVDAFSDCDLFNPTIVVNSNTSYDAYYAYVKSSEDRWNTATSLSEETLFGSTEKDSIAK